MKKIGMGLVLLACMSCQQPSVADVDYDGKTDVFIKGDKARDANTLDNIFIIDGIVVNGVSNEQWKPVDGNLTIVKQPTFTMKYDASTKEWKKLPLNN